MSIYIENKNGLLVTECISRDYNKNRLKFMLSQNFVGLTFKSKEELDNAYDGIHSSIISGRKIVTIEEIKGWATGKTPVSVPEPVVVPVVAPTANAEDR